MKRVSMKEVWLVIDFERQLSWVKTHMPVTRTVCAALPDLAHMRLACSVHLDIKMVAAFEAFLQAGARVHLTTCNPSTVRDEVVRHLQDLGATAHAWYDMDEADFREGVQHALAWGPTHTCEMGAELSVAAHRQGVTGIRAGLEATGSGITRLRELELTYPVYNWDDVPIKEGLHNRYLVGLSTWQAFTHRTWLSLHNKHVVVVGYGLVGQGVAEAAKAFGAHVSIAERDPARRLEARYAGWHTGTLLELAPRADVLVSATGVQHVISQEVIEALSSGCFLINVGHLANEIKLSALGTRQALIPYVEVCELSGKTIYLFAGGSMANLTAGPGDSLNAFDITLAVMVGGVGWIATNPAAPPGVIPLPRGVWLEVADRA